MLEKTTQLSGFLPLVNGDTSVPGLSVTLLFKIVAKNDRNSQKVHKKVARTSPNMANFPCKMGTLTEKL